MKQLLIEEMKRAIAIMESKGIIETMKVVPYEYGSFPTVYTTVDKETTELRKLLRAIRRHSILLEKDIK